MRSSGVVRSVALLVSAILCCFCSGIPAEETTVDMDVQIDENAPIEDGNSIDGASTCADGRLSDCSGRSLPDSVECDGADAGADSKIDGEGDPGACKPSCHAKSCGDNGCGGTCGSCENDYQCNPDLGACFFAGLCTPACGGKECGSDGCGGVCGSCAPGFQCVDFQCQQFDCQPDCEGKECGSDGCGATCGSCPADPDCPQAVEESSGQTCDTGVDLGVLADDGANVAVTGNITPAGDEDWYTFTAEDGPDDEDCDTFHVSVRFKENPKGQFVLDVFADGCSWTEQVCNQVDRFDWFVDFSAASDAGTAGKGECPCSEDADHQLTPPEQIVLECVKKSEILTPCPGGQKCANGSCYKVVCPPDCESKSCGPNGCGGNCGYCQGSEHCQDGVCLEVCLSDSGCADASSTICSANGLGILKCVEVEPGCFQFDSNVAYCDGDEMCVDGQCVPSCIPDCAGKVCGSDGCGGTCGECPDMEYCDEGACGDTCISDSECQEEGVVLCNDAGTGYVVCKLAEWPMAPNSDDDTTPTVHECTDNTRIFHVRVYRSKSVVSTCENYTLEFSNGLHPFSVPEQ